MHQFFHASDCLRGEKGVGTHIADLCWHIIEHEHLPSALHGMNNKTALVMPWATFNTAFHSVFPLVKGSFHFGILGSYTVMIIARSSDVVQTMCMSLPATLWP